VNWLFLKLFFAASLRLPVHRFVVEVLRRLEVQIHQLTPNAMAALAKYVWVVSSYGEQPSVEVFAKNYYLHWQKRKIGDKIAQFGSCTFTPRTEKTSAEVIEIVPCAKNKWGHLWEFWFYVAPGDVEGLPSLPPAILCSHCYVAFPHFEVAEDQDEGALRYARLSSGRDLVEKFIACRVWPLAHGWDIRGSNVWLNRVFELNNLPYGSYLEGDSTDSADRQGKQVRPSADEGPSRDRAPGAAFRKRKLGTTGEESGLRATGHFVKELLEMCAALGELMSLPELRETSLRMLKVTRGQWPRNGPIPQAAGEDFFTSRLARDLKIFPYGRNIGVVVSTVMEKDRQDAQRKKCRAPVRLVDPGQEVKLARPSAKAATPGPVMPPPAMPAAALSAF
jgi:hypothetical protein